MLLKERATSYANIEHYNYRMLSLIDPLLFVVLYASLATHYGGGENLAEAKPTSEISISEPQTSNFESIDGGGGGSVITTTTTTTTSTAAATPASDPIRAIHYHFDQKMDAFMQLHMFNSTSAHQSNNEDAAQQAVGSGNMNPDYLQTKKVTCNDGSPAGYYKRLNSHSKSWIIYLQGGGFCGSEEACQHRWRHSAHLMTSNFWPESLSVDGILSSEPKDNPYLWNANHIYVPYCSSDSWTGHQEAQAGRLAQGADSTSPPSFAFMGSRIIEKVLESLFDDLPRDSSLFEAKFILLAGDSAGATGVMMNLDRVNRFVQQRFASLALAHSAQCNFENPQLCEQMGQVPIVRGIADSGWFLDNEPYDIYQQEQQHDHSSQDSSSAYTSSSTMIEQQQQQSVDCVRQRCSPLQSIRQAMIYWNGQVPAACATRHRGEPWRCYFGYRAYPSLRTPLFVVQWLYDEAQLMVDNIIRPGTNSQWNYVNKLVGELRASLENVTALFAPSCLSHSLIIKQSWNQININGFKLPHLLNSWEEETLASQPTLEILAQDEQQHRQQQRQRLFSITSTQQQQQAILNSNQVGRDQLFDRPQQQQFEMRSAAAHRSFNTGGSSTMAAATTTASSRARSRKKKRNNQQVSSTSARVISSNRLSRSTVPVEESTSVVFNNNVPEVLVMSTSSTGKRQEGHDKFRLIDSCGWPQCNRDCPNLDMDFRPVLSY